MNKCVYRNFYYVKECICDFFQINKKMLFWSVISLIIGFAFGLFVGLNNCENFTLINITDGILLDYLRNESWLLLFFKMALKYLFYVFLIMILCNFNFLSYLSFLLFGYVSFNIIYNAVIISCLFGLSGIIYAIFCYFLLLMFATFLLVIIFLMCKCSASSCGQSNKFALFPIKSILIMYLLILLTLLIFSLLSILFVKFITIIC